MTKVVCPDCENELKLEDGRTYAVGDVLECGTCGAVVEVVEVQADGTLVVRVVEEEK